MTTDSDPAPGTSVAGDPAPTPHATAEQVQAANELGLSYAQLEQQASEAAALMGFNYANLNAQDKRFMRQYALDVFKANMDAQNSSLATMMSLF